MHDISPQAIIEKGATIGQNVSIGPFSYIGAKVTLGDGCVIENNVTIIGKTEIGQDSHISAMAVIGSSRDKNDIGQCQIGKACKIREHVTIYAGKDKPTIIGDDNLIMIASVVGQGVTIGHHGIFANYTYFGDKCSVDDYVHTSAFVTIGGYRVGAYTFIAGYVDVNRDVPPFAIVQGAPFRVRGVNITGLQRCGFSEDDVSAIKTAIRELFNGEGMEANPQVLARLSAESSPDSHVGSLCRFVRESAGGKNG